MKNSPEPELSIPERFQVLETVSQDGLAVVQRCKDRTLGREVLIKRPGAALGEFSHGRGTDQLTLREARALAQVNHPGVQRLLEVIEAPGGVMLVLEPVVGETLAERLERDGRLPVEEVARLGVEIADALVAVHAIGTVHRDVSEHNITLRPDGSACLSGFRFAKFSAQGEGASTIGEALLESRVKERTEARLLPDHPAPEQFGGEIAGARTDLFGLGCVLYRALTGEQAFPDMLDSGWSLPTSPSKRVSAVPKRLAKAIMSCLARSPVGRVQSAAELRDALRAVGVGSAKTAGDPKPRSIVGLVSGVVAVAAVVTLVVVLGPYRSNAGEPVESNAGERGVSVVGRNGSGSLLGGSEYESRIDKSYALLIGIGTAYRKNGHPTLPNASRDVEAIAKLLADLPRDWDVTVLLEEEATRTGILEARVDLEAKLELNDRALIFYAGHGMAHPTAAESGWIVPSDGQTLKNDRGRTTWIRYEEFNRFFDEARAKHILILMDCCYSGRFANNRSAGVKTFEQRYLSSKAHVVITSGRGDETVQDGISGKHSPFATAFMRAIRSSDASAITSSAICQEIRDEFLLLDVAHEPQLYNADPIEQGQFVFFLE